ncbi:hypothetical protein EXT68_21870 [Pectobacterium parmentieri]|uniref:Uncharacterized protein n=1 Tax=Pectobacterium parmentieri TaxID=1905730 RepID=A0A0H3I4A2_PECPM|nr:hypothetical protein [Pectobacterium parmentieri]AFI90420.1 Hypothetical protein W5S_2332 [Pectobacterium parmentieri]MBI0473393.1 hypothetical protein [Pectobacterium parmentieri]MBI0496023.1 hypothetical protein [Pectobacterium parmentieri]MBI0557425.1 hypothetical protein [Pectobacterium parmentieri]MBI0570564.1 hypothetical protein [Pectobacterium parmentieri]
MKRKIISRNKLHLTCLLEMAIVWDWPLSSVVNFSTDSAESKNAARLLRRGKLRPDWERAEPWYGEFLLPFAGPSGKIYHYQIVSHRGDD